MTEDKKKYKYQVSIADKRVMEYNQVGPEYHSRNWFKFETILDFLKFLKSKDGKKFELSDGMNISMITQKDTDRILSINLVASIDCDVEGAIEEHVFDSKEEANDFIKKENLKPSSNLLDEESKDQLSKFFSGKKCFFPEASKLQSDYFDAKEKLEASDVKGEIILGMEYEQKVVDILINY
jgi:hypothetical protein